MIAFTQFKLENGLQVFVHEDPDAQIAAINLLYKVGSRNESPTKTGFAHLFEHLMFGGSKNVKNFDEPLQTVGGENNAFTNTDITNYYMTLPAENLETGFWLESDRMLSLSFDPKILEIQKRVVVEEFKQRYLNQPYGDVWLMMRPLAYKRHPYQWPTIGKDISHIEGATMEDVKSFFYKYYAPGNAVLAVGGKVEFNQVRKLAEKWFGDIPAGNGIKPEWSYEPEQIGKRNLEVERDVPADAIYKVYHMPARFERDYYAADLLSDVLGGNKSSRLFKALVEERRYFSSVVSYVTGSLDPGLLVINGRLNDTINLLKAEQEIDDIVNETLASITDEELEKVQNQAEATLMFADTELLNRVMNIAFFSLSGLPESLNQEVDKIRGVTKEDIKRVASKVVMEQNASVLYYKSKNK